jgi:hypothetical protein
MPPFLQGGPKKFRFEPSLVQGDNIKIDPLLPKGESTLSQGERSLSQGEPLLLLEKLLLSQSESPQLQSEHLLFKRMPTLLQVIQVEPVQLDELHCSSENLHCSRISLHSFISEEPTLFQSEVL